jgi:hypothetical protein
VIPQIFAPSEELQHDNRPADVATGRKGFGRFWTLHHCDQIGLLKPAALNPGPQAGLQAEIEAVEAAMASAMTDGLPLDSEAVQGLVQRHHAWVAQGWPAAPTAQAYAGLALMYLEHPDFTARYEARAAGLTEYLT